MRGLAVLAAVALLSGCASRPTVVRSARPAPRPAATTPGQAAQPVQASATTPAIVKALEPAPAGPGAAVPLEGFRPMRGQARPGA